MSFGKADCLHYTGLGGNAWSRARWSPASGGVPRPVGSRARWGPERDGVGVHVPSAVESYVPSVTQSPSGGCDARDGTRQMINLRARSSCPAKRGTCPSRHGIAPNLLFTGEVVMPREAGYSPLPTRHGIAPMSCHRVTRWQSVPSSIRYQLDTLQPYRARETTAACAFHRTSSPLTHLHVVIIYQYYVAQ